MARNHPPQKPIDVLNMLKYAKLTDIINLR